ncbi:MAG: hypothetical protein AAF360_17075 [Pseudomonadota bacterium]
MSRGDWHTLRDGAVVTVARRLPARFDVMAEAAFPLLRRGRLAHLIRQDVWRALQNQRGFSPVVRVERMSAGLAVRAGGRLDAPATRSLRDRIAAVLDDPANRSRWARDARLKGGDDDQA